MVRKTNRNRKTYKKRKIMRGGFNGEEEGVLQALGFSQEDIEFLQGLNMNMDLIQTSLNTINLTTGIHWTPQELIIDLHNIVNDNNSSISSIHSSLGNSYLSDISADLNASLNDSLNLSNISGESDHNIDIDIDNNDFNDFNDLHQQNLSQDLSQDSSLHLSDLPANPSALTDYPSDNSNASNFSNVFNNSSFSIDSYNEEDPMEGGKSNKSRNSRKTRKTRKSKKSKKSKKSRKTRKTRR